MHFSMKSYLKSTRNYTAKHAVKIFIDGIIIIQMVFTGDFHLTNVVTASFVFYK